MLRRRGLRRVLAVMGLILGVVFAAGVVWSIASGEAEWWSALLLLPAALIMYRLYAYLMRGGRS